MDGTDVARELKSSPGTAGIPVVALTAGTRRTAVANGYPWAAFAGHIEKPIDVREFPGRVPPLLRDRPAERSA
jgi:CheY-like chemotaxis protein